MIKAQIEKKRIKMRIIVKKLMALLAVLMVLTAASCTPKQTTEQELTDQEIEIVRQDIISQYGFEAVAWQSIEKVEHENGDFYVFTCIVQEDGLYQYTFGVRITNSHGAIDVDTWRICADERSNR